MPIFTFSAASLVGAFLLFLMQPMMGKSLLPWFGGTPLVWTVCMMFFQAVLLLGYVYAHILYTKIPHRIALVVHSGVLLLGVISARFLPMETSAPDGNGSPLFQLIGILTHTVSIPFFALAATSPLVQSFFHRRFPERSPYPLYAVSNIGSLGAVLVYPFVLEPLLSLKTQETVFHLGYFVFLALSFAAMFFSLRSPVVHLPQVDDGDLSDTEERGGGAGTWILLSALGVMLLLSTTEQISRNLAVSSVFWMLPLCLYLLSFVLCFRGTRRAEGHRSTSYIWAVTVSVVGVQLFFGNRWGAPLQLVSYLATLFVGCLACHGALYGARPGGDRLTAFYLYISLGGVLGGIFVGAVAPRIFPLMWEYPLAWAGTAVFIFLRKMAESDVAFLSADKKRSLAVLSIAALAAVLGLIGDVLMNRRDASVSVRSFFGRLAVYQSSQYNCLYHGIIRHGCQWRDPRKSQLPTTYFGPNSGVGVAVRALRLRQEDAVDPALQIGVVGLGIGTSAAWGEKGDSIRFYEIDDQVKVLAERYFTFLSGAQADIDIVLGDARLSLQREDAAKENPLYDLLVIDAFSGDAIPLHLLTEEAAALYWRRLKKDGVLAVHISNRYLDLKPVLFGLADRAGKTGLLMDTDDVMADLIYGSTWVVMTGDKKVENLMRGLVRVHPRPDLKTVVFTDQFSNLLDLM